MPYLKLFYFRSGFNCYLRLWTYYGKPGNDSFAVLFLDLSTPTGGTLKINFSTEKMNYLVCLRYFGLVTVAHMMCHRYYCVLDFFQVVVKVGVQSVINLNERIF